jgi:TolB-like protein/Tfp pilus assembly protein PilF
MSSDQEQDYLCDGIAEDIINSLSHIEGLQVASRTSSFAVRDTAMDIREIGGKLGVETVVEGSVRKSGNQLRITAQLVKTSDGYHLWSDRFDREVRDVFTIQDEIGRSIVDALKVKLTDRDEKALSRVHTTDLEAYEFYVRGRRYFHSLGKKGLEYARNMFTSAIIRDSSFALAYCGLADCYSMIQVYYDSDRTNVENALTASRRALELDPDLAEAHASYGLAISIDGRYGDAVDEFEKAIDLSPGLFETYYFYARSCRSNGDMEQAADLFEKASAVRPEDYQAPLLAADTYRGLDQPERMEEAFRRGLAAAEKHLEFHPEDARAWYLGAHAHAALDARDEAMRWNQRAMELSPDDPATLYNAACLFSILGEVDHCFESLDLAVDNGFAHPQWLKNDPDLEPIRTDPRYLPLLERLG